VSGRIGHYLRIEQRILEEIDQVEIRFIPLTVDDTIVEEIWDSAATGPSITAGHNGARKHHGGYDRRLM
jgi:hypothetical protein